MRAIRESSEGQDKNRSRAFDELVPKLDALAEDLNWWAQALRTARRSG
jgi:hypothetical protein